MEPRSDRREAERQEAKLLDKFQSTFPERIVFSVRKRWKGLCATIVGSAVPELLRGFARDRAMELVYQHLGTFGAWLATYPLAFVTVGIIIVVIWFVVCVLKEAKPRDSIILDEHGNPAKVRNVSRKWAAGAVAVSFAFIVLLICGVYSFYRVAPINLLDKYPLGYVLFDLSKKQEVFPLVDKRQFASDYVLDWTDVGYSESVKGELDVSAPRIYDRYGNLVAENFAVRAPLKIGKWPANAQHLYTFGNVVVDAEILNIHKDGIVFVLGMKPNPMRRF